MLSHFSHVRLCATPYESILNYFSHVQLFVTPWTIARQASPSLGFSRQKHWSGLPFPSPVHESEKWKWSRSVVSDPQRPHGPQPTCMAIINKGCYNQSHLDFPSGPAVKNPPAMQEPKGDAGLIPGLGRPPGGEHGKPLQYTCLENSMDRGAWRAVVHGVTKSWTWLKWFNMLS